MNRLVITTVLLVLISPSAHSAETVPLSEILTTSPQPGLRKFTATFPNADERRKLSQRLNAFSSGASNVFMVDAPSPQDAFKASLSVLEGAHTANYSAPVNKAQPIRGNHWLVAYLGLGPSEPCFWIVESIEINADQIQLKYHQAKAGTITADVARYYYWIPLGTLQPGPYQLNLLNSADDTVTLSRRVTIQTRRSD
jgi:hypothetical protein